MYMIPIEFRFLSICYFHIDFHLTPTIEVCVFFLKMVVRQKKVLPWKPIL